MELKTLGRNIRRVRQSKGETQDSVAKNLGCSLNTYTKIERGETNVPFMRLVQIAKYLNVNVSELVRDLGEPDIRNISSEILTIKNDIQAIKNMLLEH